MSGLYSKVSKEEQRAKRNARQNRAYRLRRAGKPDGRKIKPRLEFDINHPRIAPEPNCGCWLWRGALHRKGYGVVVRRGGVGPDIFAHRAFYEAAKGPVPQGLVLDHLCRVITCVNPDHLEAVTQRENIMRGNGFAATFAKRTHCKCGHPFSGENLFYRRAAVKGKLYMVRGCRLCERAAGRRKYSRHKVEIQARRLARKVEMFA